METITIFTAGAARGNPGPAGIGVCVVGDDDQVVLEHKTAIGNAAADFAAYQAVASALEVVQAHYGDKTKDITFEIKLDSESVKKQLNGEDQVTDPGLASHFIHVHNLCVVHYPHLSFTHIDPAQNIHATKLVDEALDGG